MLFLKLKCERLRNNSDKHFVERMAKLLTGLRDVSMNLDEPFKRLRFNSFKQSKTKKVIYQQNLSAILHSQQFQCRPSQYKKPFTDCIRYQSG